MTKALITGITGQDGSYLAELLLEAGYEEVHGIVRRSSTFNTSRIDHIFDQLWLHHGDMVDGTSLRRILAKVEPDEIYHLAAQSHVQVSFDVPVYTGEVDALGIVRLLEAVEDLCPEARLYNASTSEMFGMARPPQYESTPLMPVSPYGAAKAYAHRMVQMYRDGYGLWAVNGILFNHESPRRGETFVTRKITRALAQMACGNSAELLLGDIDAKRDWGHARDYVRAMYMMMHQQRERPEDYVIASGESRSVRDFLQAAVNHLGFRLDQVSETRFDVRDGDVHRGRVTTGVPRYLRPIEIPELRGDSSKAQALLGWKPETTFEGLVAEMVDHDVARCDVRP